MSHLTHTITLKSKLLELGVTDPADQKRIVENAYVRALVKYLFTYKYVFSGYTEEVESNIYHRLAKWNEISPINGPFIVEKLKAIVRNLKNEALAGGQFTPIKNANETFDELSSEEFIKLMDWLFGEMVTGND